MAPVPKVARIGKALKTGASKVIPIRRSARPIGTVTTPATGEQPAFVLKVQVISCSGLLGVDRSGKSDPFVAVSLLSKTCQTPALNATLDPEFPPAESTFEFPVYSSTAENLGALELVIWDKNKFTKKEYIGEVAIPIEEWFPGTALHFDDQGNVPITRQLQSTRNSRPAQGSIQIKLGLLPTTPNVPDVDKPYQDMVRRSQDAAVTLSSAPPTEGIGTVRSDHGHEPEDDGLLTEDETEEETENQPRHQHQPEQHSELKVPGIVTPESSYALGSDKDVLGIVLLEINKAEDLPKLKNMTRTGWDMDPFVVISFSKKVFRTRVLRHNLNPTWDEKLLFHVRRFEANFNVQLTVLDWDKLSGNDLIGETTINLAELINAAPKPDPETGLYADLDTDHEMKSFTLPVKLEKDAVGDGSHKPMITFKGKYQPYDLLRQRFWAHYLKQYDADDTGTYNHVEITAMLDSLGSTLSRETLNTWFTRLGKDPVNGELQLEEVITFLEEEASRPLSQKKRLASQDDTITAAPSGLATPSASSSLQQEPLALDKIDFTGPDFNRSPDQENFPDANPGQAPGNATVIGSLPVPAGPHLKNKGNSLPTAEDLPKHAKLDNPERQQTGSSEDEDTLGGANSEDNVERLINVKACPICHRPRLNQKGEMDIITHLAVCASQDWEKVDRITVGNFVTASQAQRKWYTKALAKLSTGSYSIGANSANVIVQNRLTGQLEEEKMQGFVRIGIRLLYKGARSRMEGAQARRLLKSMSVKEGLKFDNPESAKGIPAFVEFHNLNVDEMALPLDSYKTFNEFFYRKLKPDARPVDNPNDPRTVVSAADCRLVAFQTINDATKIWIKGREFSVARLLGDKYKDEIGNYDGGALVIFRLAPQDYHRFHSPVDGKIGPMTYISGQYYTVNPQAIRTQLDVYGENVRKIVPIDTPTFGRVFCACIGAMMVGTIQTTLNEGDEVKRGQEFGYFAFGGSTIVAIFPKNTVTWDQDLLDNSSAPLETLVRVGMHIGRKIE